MHDRHLYKRAVASVVSRPLWHVGRDISLFAGPLQRNDLHHHSVAVFLKGLYGPFRFRAGDAAWTTCEAAVIPAGIAYEFDMRGEALAVVYLEPAAGSAATLGALLDAASEVGGARAGSSCSTRMLRDAFEDQASAGWVAEALQSLLPCTAKAPRERPLDQRITLSLRALNDGDTAAPVAEMARAVGLSASRFQHLFAAEVGVPYRRYRGWVRMRTAIGEVVRGANLTTAAHASGYADQPHFARDFRRFFGATASPSLVNARG